MFVMTDELLDLIPVVQAFEVHELDTSEKTIKYRVYSEHFDIEINDRLKELLDLVVKLEGKKIRDMVEAFRNNYPNATESAVLKGFQLLIDKNVLLIEGCQLLEKSKPEKMPGLFLRKKIINSRQISRFLKLFQFLLNKKLIVASVLLFILLDFTIIYSHFAFDGFGYFSTIDYFLVFGLLSMLMSLFHEVGHASAMQKYGLYADMGIGLYYFNSVVYVDTHEAWKLPRKDRSLIAGAGVYFNLVLFVPLSLLCLIIRSAALRDGLLLFNFTALRTFNPFLKMDGYWLLSDVLGVTNLQNKMTQYFQRILGKRDTHSDPFADYPGRIRRFILLYTMVFFCFMFVFLVSFTVKAMAIVKTFNYSLLQPLTYIVRNYRSFFNEEYISNFNLALKNSFILMGISLFTIGFFKKIITTLAANKRKKYKIQLGATMEPKMVAKGQTQSEE